MPLPKKKKKKELGSDIPLLQDLDYITMGCIEQLSACVYNKIKSRKSYLDLETLVLLRIYKPPILRIYLLQIT